jgi:hypothetical protein
MRTRFLALGRTLFYWNSGTRAGTAAVATQPKLFGDVDRDAAAEQSWRHLWHERMATARATNAQESEPGIRNLAILPPPSQAFSKIPRGVSRGIFSWR